MTDRYPLTQCAAVMIHLVLRILAEMIRKELMNEVVRLTSTELTTIIE